MKKILATKGYEVFTQYDQTADLIEIFADSTGETYIGCCDTDAEALIIGNEWILESLAT